MADSQEFPHTHASYSMKIILIILKNVLLVDSTKHDMINAGSALCPFLSRHVLMIF
jgi:hypothetical protein